MIARLTGKVDSVLGNLLILDVNGVGYEVFGSAQCVAALAPGDRAAVVIYTDVKEDSIRLYGFVDQLEKQVFMLLLSVSGVGAKTASQILSHIDRRELLRAIAAGDIHRLQSVKGIGKKTAERIVLELKDRVSEFAEDVAGYQRAVGGDTSEPYADAIKALQALGFSRSDSERAVKEVERSQAAADADSGLIVREALKHV